MSCLSLCVQSLEQISTKQPLKYLLNEQKNFNTKDMMAFVSVCVCVKGTSRVAEINK